MPCPLYDLSTTFIASLTTVCCISGILAVVENLAVLLAVRNIRSLRSTARFFMASTGAAELLSGFPGNLYYGLNHPRNESTFMKTESAMLFFPTASVTLSLSNVALDRYIAITSPLQYHNSMTLTRCLILIIFSWCLAFLSTSTAFMVSEENLVQMWIIESITFVLIPFCIKTFCYFRICQATKITFPVRENILETQLTKRRKHAA